MSATLNNGLEVNFMSMLVAAYKEILNSTFFSFFFVAWHRLMKSLMETGVGINSASKI